MKLAKICKYCKHLTASLGEADDHCTLRIAHLDGYLDPPNCKHHVLILDLFKPVKTLEGKDAALIAQSVKIRDLEDNVRELTNTIKIMTDVKEEQND